MIAPTIGVYDCGYGQLSEIMLQITFLIYKNIFSIGYCITDIFPNPYYVAAPAHSKFYT